VPQFAIVDRTKSGPGSVLMIVDERDEAEIIAMEMRRAHFDIGVIEIATDRDPDTPRAAP
jgi:hypothetical protein